MARRIKFQIEYQKFPKNNLFTILLKKKKEKEKEKRKSNLFMMSLAVVTKLLIKQKNKRVVNTVLAPVSVWPLKCNISVPVNTGVLFRVYCKYIYNTFLIPNKIINSKQVKSNNTNS